MPLNTGIAMTELTEAPRLRFGILLGTAGTVGSAAITTMVPPQLGAAGRTVRGRSDG